MNVIHPMNKILHVMQLNFKVQVTWRLQYYWLLLKKYIRSQKLGRPEGGSEEIPLVYSCSGCSTTAQMANYLALQFDRIGTAEMSCIAGVGGDVKKLVRTAHSGRKIIVIDGCKLACAKACLIRHSIVPDQHFELTGLGIKKKQHEDFDVHEARRVLEMIGMKLNRCEKQQYSEPYQHCEN